MIKNILWDLDGTFFDTYPAITYAISKALNEMGQSIELNVIDRLARQSIEHCLTTLSQRFKLEPYLLESHFAESYRSIPPTNQPPFPGAREVCEVIHKRHGLNVVITHRRIQSTQQLINAHALSALIDDIYSAEQGYPLKPNPSMLLAALEKYNLKSDETLMIGDRDIDIQAGQAAGVRTCLFGQVELTISSDMQINAYGQLLEMLTAQ